MDQAQEYSILNDGWLTGFIPLVVTSFSSCFAVWFSLVLGGVIGALAGTDYYHNTFVYSYNTFG